MKTIGAYEAKTRLAALLDEVASGESITITRHGVPVAELVPAGRPSREAVRKAIQEIKDMGAGRRLDGLTIREMIEEGRPGAASCWMAP